MRKYSGKNERKNIFIQFIYNKDLVYNWNVIYSLINKQFLRLKILNNFLRDKQQYYSFFLYNFSIFYVTQAKYYACMYLSL